MHRLRGTTFEQRALIGLLGVGLLLRLIIWIEWRPAFLGFSDSASYLVNSTEGNNNFTAVLRSPGYPIALRLIRGLADDLAFITAVQHLLGLASAALLYAAAIRLGTPRRWALVPAAVVALSGSMIWLENAVMAEGWFVFVLSLALWLTARTLDAERLVSVGLLGAAAGLLLGWAAITRPVAVLLVPFVPIWLAVAVGGTRGRRIAAAAPALAAGAIVLGVILSAAHDYTGTYSFSRNDAYQSYGRVAPFVDCRYIDVPEGTETLCPETEPRDRHGHDTWVFTQDSPVVKTFGPVGGSIPAEDLAKVTDFTIAAVLGQPKAYARAVARDIVRVVDPEFYSNPNPAVGNSGQGCIPECMLDHLVDPAGERNALSLGPQPASEMKKGNLSFMGLWERSTRLVGLPMLLVLALAYLAPFVTRDRARHGSVLLLVTTANLIVFPILTVSYDWRYVLVALGPLSAAAALGAAGLLERRRAA